MTMCAWVNAANGVAGDMLLAALVDAGADRLAVMNAWAALELDGFAATWETVDRSGIQALWTNIAIHDGTDEPGSEHQPAHSHSHSHDPHRPASEVIALIEAADLPERVKSDSIAVYRALAEVEGTIHGIDPADVELHEVGALDSILDIVGVCAALDDLGVEHLVYSGIGIGHGTVNAAHGTMPNPAPAVTRLLGRAGAMVLGVDTTMELSTPTGVALLTTLGAGSGPMPTMAVQASGFGAGTADPVGRANVVNVVIGSISEGTGGDAADQAFLVETNVDDITGEIVAHTIAELIRVGANDAWATPIVMKKGRPAYTISALVADRTIGICCDVLLAETGSLGLRTTRVGRQPVERRYEHVDVDGQRIGVKIAAEHTWHRDADSGIDRGRRVKVEHDDALRAALELRRPLREILIDAETEARRQFFGPH